jgi:hypothetical protein
MQVPHGDVGEKFKEMGEMSLVIIDTEVSEEM